MSIERALELQQRSWSLQSDGKLEDAVLACREALRLIEEADPASPDVANLLNDLAEIEFDRRNLDAALALTERAGSIEHALGGLFAGEAAARIRARTLSLAGLTRRARGDYADAEIDLRRALDISLAEFGETSLEAAEARNNLAVVYKYSGRFGEGLALYSASLPHIVAAHGAQSLETATLYHNIGGLLHAQGDFAGAEAPARKAWELSRALVGDDDPRAMADAAAYAAVLDGLERYEESTEIYRRALAVFERVFGPEHEEVGRPCTTWAPHWPRVAIARRQSVATAEP